MERGQKVVTTRDNFRKWLESLIGKFEFIAMKDFEGRPFFVPLSSLNEIKWDFERLPIPNSLFPPKDFVFPNVEELFKYRRENGKYTLEPVEPDTKKKIIFGIRSCDVAGMAYTDKFFREAYPDNYYIARRGSLLLISFACTQPGPECFCICCDGGPILEAGRGFDVQVVDLGGERYLLEVGTAEGGRLITADENLFESASSDDLQKFEKLKREVLEKFGGNTAYMAHAIRKMTQDAIPHDKWVELGWRCTDCGGCSFVCPLCTCFGVADLGGEDGARVRFWDSCDYPGYTLEASGHNPRGDKGLRFKHRFWHKLSYQYIKRIGRTGCTGCARCSIVCPGGVGIAKVVTSTRKE